MVAWILAIGLLVAGAVWYFYGGLTSPGVADPGAALTPGWDGVGSRGDGADSGQIFSGGAPPLHSGYTSPRTTGAPPPLPPPTAKVGFVPPSTGPAIQARRGVGAF